VLGAHWLVEHHPDLFDGCTEAIGEVGGFSTEIGGKRLYLIESGEKGIAWLRLRARGTAGHGSMGNRDNAITHLASGLLTLGQYEWPDEPGPSMRILLDKVRELTSSDGTPDELLEHFGPAIRMLGAGIRNSTNATMLEAGYKHNVVPGEAVAYVDGRYLPGHAETFIPTVQQIVGDQITVEPYITDAALEYAFEGDLVDAMTVALHSHDPEAHIAPFLMSGGTDAKAWEKLGITSFGFTPLRLPADLDFTALFHGIDERVPVESLEFGAKVFDTFLGLL
jgi:acetylornithine deacetylase/succinyl-diaminopimelate desuccinylase-like protein